MRSVAAFPVALLAAVGFAGGGLTTSVTATAVAAP
jgi:hypothetical protein